MCGIVGYIAKDDKEYQNARRGFFKYALALDTLRGGDSTGVISVDKKFTVRGFRTLAPGLFYAPSKDFEERVPNGWAMIGHNRAATVGKVTIDNAHPFHVGSIHLVHNGTLVDDGSSLPTYDYSVDVDSHQIAIALNSVPPKDAVSILEKIDGDFALVWTDSRDKSINMCRNAGRPMHFGTNYDRSLLTFMSDGQHLDIISKSLRNTGASINSINSLDTFQLLKWKQRGTLKPEVTRFRPYLQAKREDAQKGAPASGKVIPFTSKDVKKGDNNGPKPLSHPDHRLNRKFNDAKLRKSQLDIETAMDSGTNFLINENIKGAKKAKGTPTRITSSMIRALYKSFSLDPKTTLPFDLEATYDITSQLSRCAGEVKLPDGGCWEAAINFVNTTQATAWRNYTWLVRPIGVTVSFDGRGTNSSAILCDLIHTNYEKEPVESNEKSDIIKDPHGNLVNKHQLYAKLAKGCVHCGDVLEIDQIPNFALVNENQDVICQECKWRDEFEQWNQ